MIDKNHESLRASLTVEAEKKLFTDQCAASFSQRHEVINCCCWEHTGRKLEAGGHSHLNICRLKIKRKEE